MSIYQHCSRRALSIKATTLATSTETTAKVTSAVKSCTNILLSNISALLLASSFRLVLLSLSPVQLFGATLDSEFDPIATSGKMPDHFIVLKDSYNAQTHQPQHPELVYSMLLHK
ncbi:hypothetical protein EYB25_002607 [Talaromyces marneffei]|uniref:Uncharacterized protein n=1 Tax=Talaromyces marneffei (strain ATCC 18224 / CBS 334.59 / QM 7333) TaxID=441960 RepID=B6QAS9_TALMQ|nr:hypothetical protein PMAA_064520 [Talaromyces marneffei ATCC 18224]KAE8554069.1 hypothetical protein EYB25_002607 [Talaromyces marneffei]